MDALSLESAPVAATPAQTLPHTRLFIEGVVGRIAQRYGLPTLDAHRLSIDFSHSAKLGSGWRAAVSDRLDNLSPTGGDESPTLNSLREAYASWQDDAGSNVLEFGRINLRHGTAYGYNPTDVFRDGSLRAVTSVDPIAQRENRMGTVMLRGQHIAPSGTLAVALAPKLVSSPSTSSFSLDLGATNNRNRAVLSYSSQYSDRISGQLLLTYDDVRGSQVGASMTALLSDAAAAHLEFSRGRDDNLLAQALAQAAPREQRNRAAAGLTYSTASRLSLTAEYEYNGFAPSQASWTQASLNNPNALAQFLIETQRRQENSSRGSYLVYATQKSLLVKNLDLTALLRLNADDHSRLAWLEMRYHWEHTDVALQWQQTSGRNGSEYGLVPYRQSIQLLGAYYF